MSRYFTHELSALEPYTPGEQPQNRQYIKLNTNESPYPPAPGVARAVAQAAEKLPLYPDPESGALIRAAADWFGVQPENILCGNGSDENLMLAIRAFCAADRPLAFADVTYGFYPVWCQLFGIPAVIRPLKEDFTLDPADYYGLDRSEHVGAIVIANPNAPTGLALPAEALGRDRPAEPGRRGHCGRGLRGLRRRELCAAGAPGRPRQPDGGADLLQIPQPGGGTAGPLHRPGGADF